MVLTLPYDEAKAQQIRNANPSPKQVSLKTPFFGSLDHPDMPHACINHYDADRPAFSATHFHVCDQFQVFIGGSGKIGRHHLKPYCVHFSRAYTPYGPLVPDPATGLTFFVMRTRLDSGAQLLPGALSKLKQVADRRPWQITRDAEFPVLDADTSVASNLLHPIPDVKDEQGLAAYTLSMSPNATTHAPDPSQGNGQYLMVVKGSLLHNSREHGVWSLVFVTPQEGPLAIHAGAQGLEAIVLNFPRTEQRMSK